MRQWEIVVSEGQGGERIDKYLASRIPELSRTHIAFLIRERRIHVNGKPVPAAKYKPVVGDAIVVTDEQKHKGCVPPCSVPVPIVYEDRDVILIDKPYGLIVHPVGRTTDSVVGALHSAGKVLSQIDPSRPGVVHRLDKTTSGLMLLAKNEQAHYALVNAFKERRMHKEYIAVVRGEMRMSEGEVDIPLMRIPGQPKMKAGHHERAKNALTLYRVEKANPPFYLMRLTLKTGRMHQLRVHMKYLGAPIVGDTKYGGMGHERIMLHSHRLVFAQPLSGIELSFTSPVPPIFYSFFK
jgi:23S rRNA pseudouridine1911/1915/1917 synthase